MKVTNAARRIYSPNTENVTDSRFLYYMRSFKYILIVAEWNRNMFVTEYLNDI